MSKTYVYIPKSKRKPKETEDEDGFQSVSKGKVATKYSSRNESPYQKKQQVKGSYHPTPKSFKQSPDSIKYQREFIQGTEIENKIFNEYKAQKKIALDNFLFLYSKELQSKPITISNEYVFEYRSSVESQKSKEIEVQ
ncbi:hypothetical protein EHI8A_035350 [Entamoeba histolytica HM-1:IMSS-B]|uniref:Uncharacterized protein n=6 Tax=Entamoeba histolytica TaxID=5759 RepID=C4LTB0_ENTH1|nr:hypothetical protein EHI_044910 [Entamoeba histolytica HM-1:IMSS]EMD44194.1 Hypothetical protein EHI5A_051720 [Entamoeba histolytica KU27]EMH73427.1 hypothetical protein EHI8A_035350 [Entamoeba histolytica HM-1:IMSS-B]EMS12113.1 hypothetical protein KM1_068680 [Entamoeba histolytica HM-3:IMSS]ENY61888.1 hypothetical protein EHI7A_034450 [Entamoeba histolytica HM-1:IMSS-A]GAT91788.1 hypothetical protein CL6EHI_044910 [Entamoeba histolytica]|eukprot:XP_657205.1 hypothetical protein EHI_044910 [Entamoeba histolytica HM-1:IMSS]